MTQVECLRRQYIHCQFSTEEIMVYYIKGFSKVHKKSTTRFVIINILESLWLTRLVKAV